MQLNPQQSRAVETTKGAVMIIAGAGTGKTKTLTSRILQLIATGVHPRNILAVTFTNKAAKEMKERIAPHIPYGMELPVIGTFHSLGVMILRRFGDRVGVKRGFTILDRDDQIKIFDDIIESIGLDSEEWSAKRFKERISWLRSRGTLVSEFREQAASQYDEFVAQVWERYNERKLKQNSFDFDDLLELPLKLLQRDSEVREYYQNLFEYIHIDEYQDTNDVQDKLVSILADKHKNLCVVGDTDQTIYTWRGAQIKNMLQFHKKFPEVEMITLTQNYRSSKNILDAGNAVVAINKGRIEKDLVTSKEAGEPVTIYRAYTDQNEAKWIAEQIVERTHQGDSYNDIAILYRSHFISRVLEEALMRSGIPYSVIGTKFFDRKEIKDAMAWLRAAFNRTNLSDLKRVVDFPKRGIGKVAWAAICSEQAHTLKAAAKTGYQSILKILDDVKEYSESHEVSETLEYCVKKSGMWDTLQNGDEEDQERLMNIKELISYAKEFTEGNEEATPLELFIERVSLVSDQDALDNNGEQTQSVKLMTVHAAKGLEFNSVFIAGCEQGIFPSENDDAEDPEEERRLMYVAITRAKVKLCISWSMSRRIYGQASIQTPSEFIADIPNELIEEVTDSYTNPFGASRGFGSFNNFNQEASGSGLLDDIWF